jgi:ABC-type sugar transport system ATPase subunit
MTEPLLRAERLTKRFGATQALASVDLDLFSGEVHALVGENGAGKTTLIGILSGVHAPDEGTLCLDGKPCQFATPRAALDAGIATIPQHLRLVPALSVAENIMLGALPVRHWFGAVPGIDRVAMREEAARILARLGVTPDPDRRLDTLAFAERQVVAIAKALRRNCRILILDEPTAALEAREIDRLFAVLQQMRREEVAIVYCSHRLEEVVRLADRCTVLRDGRVAARYRHEEFGVSDLVQAMTGRTAIDAPEMAGAWQGEPLLEEMGTADAAIRLSSGIVLGLAGLLGSGAERRLRRLFGAEPAPAALRMKGRAVAIAHPAAAIAEGIGMVPGERSLGLVMNQSVRDNILLPGLGKWRIDKPAGDRLVAEMMALLDIRPRRADAKVAALSGGNQQKVIFAKWLALHVGVLLLDEPTQGVDVAAKAQIHALIRDFARRGGGVLMRSSDLAELTTLCDGVLAMRQGAIASRLDRDALDEPRLRAAIGG